MRKLAPLARRVAAVAALATLGWSGTASAGGFELYEESPSGVAMAGAMTAMALDASTLFYNPAGVAMLRGGNALLGVGLGFGFTSATLPATSTADSIKTDAQPQLFTLPEVYVTHHLTERWAAGIGMFTQFGNGVHWNDNGVQGGMSVPFPGRFLATNTQIQTVTINPTVAFRVNDYFSIGAGLDVLLASAELARQLQLGDVETGAHLGGTSQGVGGNAGVIATLIKDRLAVGFSYRSAVDLTFGMQAHFGVPPELQTLLVDQKAQTSIQMPHNFSFGVMVRPLLPLTISVDVHHTLWQSLNELRVTFENPGTPALAAQTKWNASTSVRLGLQYVLKNAVALRLGLGYEKGSVPIDTLDPTAPVSDRWLVTGGVAYTVPRGVMRGFGGGVGYIAGLSADRTATRTDFPATYSQNVHLVSIALHYQWGAGDVCAYGVSRCGETPK
jgi:long-chain fatty acid transport protein